MAKRLTENPPMFINIAPEMRDRLRLQSERFGAPESVLVRMAITRWLEEEEANQTERGEKKVKLIPKTGN